MVAIGSMLHTVRGGITASARASRSGTTSHLRDLRMFRLACPVALLVLAAACAKEGTPPAAPTRLAQADSIDHLGSLAREPMVVRHPAGALFVTGYWDTI